MDKCALVCLTIATLSMGMTLDAAARERFSVRDLRGGYAFSFEGEVVGLGPVAAVGAFEADGKGNLTDAVRTLGVNGVTVRQTFSCSLTVNADGTGVATCPLDDPLPGFPAVETFDFVIEEHGSAVRFIGTTPGVVVLGDAERR